jgi:hypothetical protein
LSDDSILSFIETSSKINDCISNCISSTISHIEVGYPDIESSRQALLSFFSYLHGGEYKLASDLSGGSYDVMRNHNPEIDPDDVETLLKNACTVNGAQCLEIRQVELLDLPSLSEIRFSVEFSRNDGSQFSLGPCCGANDPNAVEQTAFIYTVRYECTGKYKVMEMPVYLP